MKNLTSYIFNVTAQTNCEVSLFIVEQDDIQEQYEFYIASYIVYLEQEYGIDVSDQI